MAQASGVTTVTGIVEAVNSNGFKIQNGNWLNYSQYGYRGPNAGQPAPTVGQFITAQVKNDKFINTLSMSDNVGNLAPAPTQVQPVPEQPSRNFSITANAQPAKASDATIANVITAINSQDRLIETTIKTRLDLLKTIAVAQPNLFVLANLEVLTETVKNLESFV